MLAAKGEDMKLISTVFVAAGAAVMLAGCTFSASANYTVPAGDVADVSAQALQDQLGAEEPPGLDCGDDDVDVVVGTTVDCVLTDPGSGEEYDTVVTISKVDGTKYSVDVQVADTAN